jgi:hypothetical protein
MYILPSSLNDVGPTEAACQVHIIYTRWSTYYIQENTPATFQWRGRFGGILLVGHRRFYFKKSEKTPGGTTLLQEEDIDGLLAFMFKRDSGQGKIARDAMEKFNIEIKARAEALWWWTRFKWTGDERFGLGLCVLHPQ